MTDELVMVVPRQALFGRSPAFQGFSPDVEAYFGRCLEEHLFMPRRRAESDERYKQVIPYVVLQTCPGPGQRYRYMIFQRTRGGDSRLGRLYSIGLGGHVNSTDVLVPPVVRASAPRSRERRERQGGPIAGSRARPELPGRLPRQPSPRPGAGPSRPRLSAPPGAGLAVPRVVVAGTGDSGPSARRVIRKLTFAPALSALVLPVAGPRSHEHPLFHGIRRELREEVVFPPGAQLSLLGVINDDSNAVGRVHFGIAFLLEVPPSVQVRRRRGSRRPAQAAPGRRSSSIRLRKEPGTSQAGDLFPLDHILAYRHAMETWSSLLLDAGVLAASQQFRQGGIGSRAI